MGASRLTDEEIAGLLQEVARGAPIGVVCASAHVSLRTFYRWKRKFAGLTPAGVKQLKALSEENRELRRLLAERAGLTGDPHKADLLAIGPSRPHPAPLDPKAREMHGLGVGRFATVRLGGR